MKAKTTQQFIKEAIIKHGNKYDYSKVEYINSETKVCIICPEHGEFWQSPHGHLRGRGCKECSRKNKTYTTEEFIKQSNKTHNNKYDYSKSVYKYSTDLITIICPIHGEFKQVATKHLNGTGCPKCGTIEGHNKQKSTLKEFIQKANIKHNSFYNYSKVEYINSYTKVVITCPIHGDFEQEPNRHLQGAGCPSCCKSHGETLIESILNTLKINFKAQYQISIDKTINTSGYAYIDFYLPDYNCFIEYNGEQHYRPMHFSGGELTFRRQIKRDNYVKNYCKDNNIMLIEFKFSDSQDYIIKILNNLKNEI